MWWTLGKANEDFDPANSQWQLSYQMTVTTEEQQERKSLKPAQLKELTHKQLATHSFAIYGINFRILLFNEN